MTIDTESMSPIELLEIATGELDHMFQEGVIVTPLEYKRMQRSNDHIASIVSEWPDWFPDSIDKSKYQ